MTKRLLFPSLLVATSLLACNNGDDTSGEETAPFQDSWREEISGPAAQIRKLVVGGRAANNNFVNRGHIEVRYVANTDQIKVEMQRFTIARTDEEAKGAFSRMHLWAYNIASPKAPSPADADKACFADGQTTCYIRSYYDGQLQPVRDGVHFRVTIPVGWDGDLELKTTDNLEAGIDTYPARSNILVDGVAGDLGVDLDSGNVQVRMDPNTKHFSGCASNDACVAAGYAIGCGCSEPTNITIASRSGQSSNITVDVGTADAWYTMLLENRGSFSASSSFVCTADLDCGAFDDCQLEPEYADLAYHERAEINYPGAPAIKGAGIRISLISESCANVTYTTGPNDFDLDEFPEEKRGDLRACVGCLADL
jgi:hypothetical protein